MTAAEEIVAPLHPVRPSPYGFGWGPALVTRMWHWGRMDRGRRRENFCFSIETGEITDAVAERGHVIEPKHRLHVCVSRTGKSVQVYLDGKKMVPGG